MDDLPVVNVSWDDADQFCRWLSNRENATYQLPTEQEWEYSCRAGTVTPFSFGTGLNANRKLLANIADQSLEHYIPKEYHGSIKFSAEDDEHIFVAPVGAFAANGFGLHDMHGNVAEWCANAFGKGKAVRGGAWWHGDSDCRSARRDSRPPSSTTLSIGFRIVRRP